MLLWEHTGYISGVHVRILTPSTSSNIVRAGMIKGRHSGRSPAGELDSQLFSNGRALVHKNSDLFRAMCWFWLCLCAEGGPQKKFAGEGKVGPVKLVHSQKF